MEDDLKQIVNGRQPNFFLKWKTTSILLSMEDNLNCFINGRQSQLFAKRMRTSIVLQMKDNLKCVWKWKTTSNSFVNGRLRQS